MLRSSTRAEKVPTSSRRKMLYLIQYWTSASQLQSAKVPEKKKKRNILQWNKQEKKKMKWNTVSMTCTDPEPCREWLWQLSASSHEQWIPDHPKDALRELFAGLHQGLSTSYLTLRSRIWCYTKYLKFSNGRLWKKLHTMSSELLLKALSVESKLRSFSVTVKLWNICK